MNQSGYGVAPINSTMASWETSDRPPDGVIANRMGPAPSARRPAPEWTCTSSAADCRGRRGCRGRPGRPTPHAGPGRSWSAVWAHHPDGARGHQGRAAPPAPAPRVDRRTRQPADAGHPRATAAAQRPRAPAGQQAARLLGQVRGDQLVQLLKVLQGGRVEALRYETAEIDAVISAEPEDRPRSTVIEAYGAIEGRVQTLSRHGGLRFTLYDTLNNRPSRATWRRTSTRSLCGTLGADGRLSSSGISDSSPTWQPVRASTQWIALFRMTSSGE